MDNPKMLSGYDLVARGTTKIDRSLPEVGLKDVVPNGTWLENKQIQSALEARKHLLEVERIEKCGVLSHAEWREELMLAEVRQKAGGHWQYFGHNVGKQLFLYPEEALFLMETNCLQLKYNDVTVSLQQAYTLLLRCKISLMQYKVYASLSRVGYKVYRHEHKKPTENADKINLTQCVSKKGNEGSKDEAMEKDNIQANGEKETDEIMEENHEHAGNSETNNDQTRDENEAKMEEVDDKENADNVSSSETDTTVQPSNDVSTVTDTNVANVDSTTMDTDQITEQKTDSVASNSVINVEEITPLASEELIKDSDIPYYQNKLKKLENRKLKPCDSKVLEQQLHNIPDFSQTSVATMTAPEEQYIPRNVFLNKISYVLYIEKITAKSSNTQDSRTYIINEEASGNHVRRIRDTNPSNPSANWTPPQNTTFPGPQFRPRNFWRPPNMFFFPFNVSFQRPFFNNVNFMARCRQPVRSPLALGMYPNLAITNQSNNDNGTSENRKRKRNKTKQAHFEAIKHLAARLKLLIASGNTQPHNIEALNRLIETFNARHRMRLRLSSTFELYNDENIIDTISLDDDEDTNAKKLRTDSDSTYNENLNKIKQLALKLKDMESKNKSNYRQRRAFSSLIRRFNRSYNAELYLNSNFEVLDKRFITLDSSSDSDCVIEESTVSNSGKKLKNPFNIIKRLSEKRHSRASKSNTSKGGTDENTNREYSAEIMKIFNENWLPKAEDFGRAEVVPKSLMNSFLMDSKREEYIFDFIKSQPFEFENWMDIKTSFLRSIQETTAMMQDTIQDNSCSIDSLVGPEDGTDMESILKKLRIIQNNNEVDNESRLTIDYDVYNRDVQNFRKSSRPTPHFRVICINESTTPPSGREIASLHAKYDDNVPITFAVVGIGSISYLQMNPVNLPVYISSNDLE